MSLVETLESLPLADAVPAEYEALRGLFKRSLYHTAKYALGYSQVNWHTHGRMVKALEDDTKRKLIVMPRGTFKTSVAAVAYPIWLLFRNPNLRILIDSEIYGNSKNTLREIKLHLESERITSVFGEFRHPTVWNEGEAIIKQKTAIHKEASLTCSGIGAEKTSQHYDVIVADDLNSMKNIGTPEMRQKVIDHYRLYTSLLEQDGIIVLIGTRWSAGDVIQFVIDTEILLSEERGLISD